MKKYFKLLIKLLLFPGVIILIFYLKFFDRKVVFLRTSRLGDFMITTEYFLRTNTDTDKYILIINNYSCANSFITNRYYYEIKKRKFCTISNNYIVRGLYWFKDFINYFSLEKEMLTYNDFNSKNEYRYSYTYPIFAKTDSIIDINYFKKDILNLKKSLKINEKNFVCLHVRDSFYLKKKFPNDNWDYHDFRNANIDEYIDIINYLNSKNFFVIKLGENENIINYTKLKFPNMYIDFSHNNFYSSKNEMLLSFFCEFMIGTYSGISHSQQILNKPMIFMNVTPFIEKPYGYKNMFIPKKLFDFKTNKYISLNESLNYGYFKIYNGHDLKKYNLKYINNSNTEMISALEEFLLFLNKKSFTPTKGQIKFNQEFEKYSICIGNENFICDSFLKKNKYLI